MGTVTRIGRGPAGLPFSRMTLKDGRFFLSGQVAQNGAHRPPRLL